MHRHLPIQVQGAAISASALFRFGDLFAAAVTGSFDRRYVKDDALAISQVNATRTVQDANGFDAAICANQCGNFRTKFGNDAGNAKSCATSLALDFSSGFGNHSAVRQK